MDSFLNESFVSCVSTDEPEGISDRKLSNLPIKGSLADQIHGMQSKVEVIKEKVNDIDKRDFNEYKIQLMPEMNVSCIGLSPILSSERSLDKAPNNQDNPPNFSLCPLNTSTLYSIGDSSTVSIPNDIRTDSIDPIPGLHSSNLKSNPVLSISRYDDTGTIDNQLTEEGGKVDIILKKEEVPENDEITPLTEPFPSKQPTTTALPKRPSTLRNGITALSKYNEKSKDVFPIPISSTRTTTLTTTLTTTTTTTTTTLPTSTTTIPLHSTNNTTTIRSLKDRKSLSDQPTKISTSTKKLPHYLMATETSRHKKIEPDRLCKTTTSKKRLSDIHGKTSMTNISKRIEPDSLGKSMTSATALPKHRKSLPDVLLGKTMTTATALPKRRKSVSDGLSKGGLLKPTQTIPTKTIPTKTIPTKTIPTKTIPTKNIPTKTIPTKNIPTKTIHIKTIPNKTIPNKTTLESLVGSRKKTNNGSTSLLQKANSSSQVESIPFNAVVENQSIKMKMNRLSSSSLSHSFVEEYKDHPLNNRSRKIPSYREMRPVNHKMEKEKTHLVNHKMEKEKTHLVNRKMEKEKTQKDFFCHGEQGGFPSESSVSLKSSSISGESKSSLSVDLRERIQNLNIVEVFSNDANPLSYDEVIHLYYEKVDQIKKDAERIQFLEEELEKKTNEVEKIQKELDATLADNVRLTSHHNGHQRIRYVEKLKLENQELRRMVQGNHTKSTTEGHHTKSTESLNEEILSS